MKYKIVNKINNKGFPVHAKGYKKAHQLAESKEKAKYPKTFPKTVKLENKLKPHELMSTESKNGKIRVEKKFKKYAKELAFHEKVEHKELLKKKNRKK